MRARLVSLDGGSALDLPRDVNLVGRDERCEVRITHPGVSKLHCVIVKTDGLLVLRDLGSTNGTRVNGQRVRRAALLPNDTVAFAGLRYQVKFGVELERSERQAAAQRPADDAEPPPVRPNPLPDVYPETSTPHG